MTQPAQAIPPARVGDGYAPDFMVTVAKKPVDEATRGDVLDVRVTLDLKNMGGFNVTFNNWDDAKLRFKYAETQDGPFAIGNRVEVQLGYAGQVVPVVAGTISTLVANYPESGSPTITVTGTDGLQKLKNRKQREGETTIYRSQADWQIAQKVAARNNLKAQVDKDGPVHDLVVQRNMDDAMFLVERANRIDFECFVRADPATGKDVLFFVKPTDGREARADQRPRFFRLAYGPGLAGERQPPGGPGELFPDLISFTPTLTLSNQVSKVTVRSWDPRAKEVISFTADRRHLPPGRGLSGPQAAGLALADRQEAVIDAPVISREEARRLAIALLRERAYGFITATGRVVGLPELVPGDNLEIHGVGERFTGTYFVLRVEHTLNGSGFFTQFQGRRVYDGSGR